MKSSIAQCQRPHFYIEKCTKSCYLVWEIDANYRLVQFESQSLHQARLSDPGAPLQQDRLTATKHFSVVNKALAFKAGFAKPYFFCNLYQHGFLLGFSLKCCGSYFLCVIFGIFCFSKKKSKSFQFFGVWVFFRPVLLTRNFKYSCATLVRYCLIRFWLTVDSLNNIWSKLIFPTHVRRKGRFFI